MNIEQYEILLNYVYELDFSHQIILRWKRFLNERNLAYRQALRHMLTMMVRDFLVRLSYLDKYLLVIRDEFNVTHNTLDNLIENIKSHVDDVIIYNPNLIREILGEQINMSDAVTWDNIDNAMLELKSFCDLIEERNVFGQCWGKEIMNTNDALDMIDISYQNGIKYSELFRAIRGGIVQVKARYPEMDIVIV